MSSLKDVQPGQWVCRKGRGADAMAHSHEVVDRVTKTMIIMTSGRRFRFDGRSIPYSPYGGTRIETRCQKK